MNEEGDASAVSSASLLSLPLRPEPCLQGGKTPEYSQAGMVRLFLLSLYVPVSHKRNPAVPLKGTKEHEVYILPDNLSTVDAVHHPVTPLVPNLHS